MSSDCERINIYVYTSKLKDKLFKINVNKKVCDFKDYLIKRVSLQDNYEIIKNETNLLINGVKLDESKTFRDLKDNKILRENNKVKFNVFVLNKENNNLLNLDELENDYDLNRMSNEEKRLYLDVAKTSSTMCPPKMKQRKSILSKGINSISNFVGSIVKQKTIKKAENNRGMLFDWNDYEDDDYYEEDEYY